METVMLEQMPSSRHYLTLLCQILDTRFDEQELRTLCFDLGVDYDSLPAVGKANKARELLSYLDRRNRIPELTQIGQQRRPDIGWPDIPQNIVVQPDHKVGSAPPLPALILGREDALLYLKTRLGITAGKQTPVQTLTVIRGWPGVGKTTITAMLAHDPDVAIVLPDGVLWVSLGPSPSLFSELARWGRALGIDDLSQAETLEEMSARLAAQLRDKRKLLIVDDVWEAEHAMPFKVGGRGCSMIINTRLPAVAQALAPTPNDIYNLPVLTDSKALELLQTLAPAVAIQHPRTCLELVRDLEGLPLALQVAGHMLNVESGLGFEVTDLLDELRKGNKLLQATAPSDRADLANETTPIVAVLLQKSTELLDAQTRECFAYLGVFAPKPATFDLEDMCFVWEVEDPKPILRNLVNRGLLEPVAPGIFQMHALMVLHARSLFSSGI